MTPALPLRLCDRIRVYRDLDELDLMQRPIFRIDRYLLDRVERLEAVNDATEDRVDVVQVRRFVVEDAELRAWIEGETNKRTVRTDTTDARDRERTASSEC